ncbi:hypothetical protein PENPOL_c021G08016 [Penicillium polonicum]|uniref:Uncharacterized protein n=1 Tax=Penicillium polonicum TaxID=60169 RepID=A0A1V6N7V1_PENPO|nr:hypothetical protein PENPOL_c021G08016 [Penicillium polonicum]
MTLLQPQSQFTSALATLTSQTVAPPLKFPLATRGSSSARGSSSSSNTFIHRDSAAEHSNSQRHASATAETRRPSMSHRPGAGLSAGRTPRRRCRSGTQGDASRIK